MDNKSFNNDIHLTYEELVAYNQGNLSNKENHHNIEYKTLNLGYYESGLVIRKLLDLRVYDLGVGVLYRYGPYSFDNVSLNFAYKFSIFYSF